MEEVKVVTFRFIDLVSNYISSEYVMEEVCIAHAEAYAQTYNRRVEIVEVYAEAYRVVPTDVVYRVSR